MPSGPASDSPWPAGEPERLFAVSPLVRQGDGFVASMTTGPWNLGPGGQPCGGTLGILVDDVLAASIAVHSPTGASVSTEIAIDLVPPVPADGRVLTCTGTPRAVTAVGGVARGDIVDDTGRLIAVATQRQRFVSPRPHGTHEEPVGPYRTDRPDEDGALGRLHGGLRDTDGGWELEVPPGRHAANPNATMHGGMSLCASALVAEAALGQTEPLLASSVRIAHLRPVPVTSASIFTAQVVHAGRTFRLAHVTGRDVGGRVVTVATVSLQAF